jgi:Toprim domain
MATTDELKARIDLHELADRLGLERPGGRGNYRSPAHDDKSPSLSIYQRPGGEWAWKDHSTDEGGSCIDLVMSVKGCDAATAIRALHEMFGIPLDRAARNEAPARDRNLLVEWIADRCTETPLRAIEYLVGERKLDEAVVRRAIERRTVGFNDWRSDKVAAGQHGYGGPAAAFIVRSHNPGHVVAVDFRYVDAALNGGTKTQCQGEKHGFGWASDMRALERAKTIVVVESPINALTVECADLPNTAAFATRGTGNVNNIDWRWTRGKRVLICMDNDQPFPDGHKLAGLRPGLKAAWELHEQLLLLDVSAQLIDQGEWEVNDLNDLLRTHSAEEVRLALKKIEPWLIPGMSGKLTPGKTRVFLPFHDWQAYGHYHVREDFTSFFTETKSTDEAGNEVATPKYADLAGFRLVALSRITVQGAIATVTGDPDTRPSVAFAATVQVPRHGPTLLRKVLEDEKLHNIDTWKRFGPVFNQAAFLRMLNIFERAAFIGERQAANFVGLCYRAGKLVVSEGADTYFIDPKQQCPYHNLVFPSGLVSDAKPVIDAYQATFARNAAAMALVWALGGHLKVFLGFWPHMQMQAEKGHGKSTLAERLERTVGMTVYSKEAIKTPFRLVVTTAHTSQPVGWEEISANRMEVIDAAVSLLQEAYNFKPSPRGAQMLEFLTCAPVLLIGEDVPVRSLIGKLVRVELTNKKGAMLADDLPRFPVRQWLEFLAKQQRAHVRDVYATLKEHCLTQSRASRDDDGAVRMAGNYAAILLAWRFLAEFAVVDVKQGNFGTDVLAEMNAHIAETTSDREPWVWIVETLLSEIAANQFIFPYVWDMHKHAETRVAEPCLLIRTAHVMDHLARSVALREKWNGLPVKSDRVFKKQLMNAGVVIDDDVERMVNTESLENKKRLAHMVAISVARLQQYGLHATPVGRSDLVDRRPPEPPVE